ncbi:MAG: FmdB family zinc ribbon protein [Burkholderiaceae bacterium]
MPIYAYRCAACGHSRDVLQKLSDAPLTVCPACGAEQFAKQLTAAGFQLKGSGWYATDFRNNGGGTAAAPAAKPEGGATGDGGSAPSSSGSSDAASSSGGGTACGGSCACH